MTTQNRSPLTISGDRDGGAYVDEQGQLYRVRQVNWQDTHRHAAYQRLRASIFVKQFGWKVPVTFDGRECDHYDLTGGQIVSVHCVYGIDITQTEHLLGGVRIFRLNSWKDSMVAREFHEVGMIPAPVLQSLEHKYMSHEVLEITRLCVQRGRFYTPPCALDDHFTHFSCIVARDLVYAAICSIAEKVGIRHVVAIVDTRYLQVMKRSHFVYKEIYAQDIDTKHGFALIVLDLVGTIRSLRSCGERARAERIMALCQEDWVSHMRYRERHVEAC